MQTATSLSQRIYADFGTSDIFQIAEKCGVKITFARWFPVTFGEFNYRTKTICVNENATVARERIIAHELGHFFVREFEIKCENEENFCDEFADNIIDPSISEQHRK